MAGRANGLPRADRKRRMRVGSDGATVIRERMSVRDKRAHHALKLGGTANNQLFAPSIEDISVLGLFL